jgi:hypothetical protein
VTQGARLDGGENGALAYRAIGASRSISHAMPSL